MNSGNLSHKLRIVAQQKIKEKKYWLDHLTGELSNTHFPYDNDTLLDDNKKDSVNFNISDTYFKQLAALSRGSDEALHMILTAGLILLLEKYTSNKDIIIGTPIYSTDSQAGEYINTVLPLRIQFQPHNSFKELLLNTRAVVIAADENLNYPIEILVEQLNLSDSNKTLSLFDVTLLLENIHQKKHLSHIPHSMMFSFLRKEQSIYGTLEYSISKYKKITIQRIIKHFLKLLFEAISNLESNVSSLKLLSFDEKKQLVYEFNNANPNHIQGRNSVRLFEEQAERTPQNIALIGPGLSKAAPGVINGSNSSKKNQRNISPHVLNGSDSEKWDTKYPEYTSLTYKELNQLSNHLAEVLIETGIGVDSVVGIMAERSIEMIVGLFAVLKAGGAYLPIDPGYPEERINYIMADSASTLLVSGEPLPLVFPLKNKIVSVSDVINSTCIHTEFNLSAIPNNSIAYVIYTSGTTGKPKGILVEHHNLLTYITAFCSEFNINRKTCVLQQASFTFDAFVEELYPSLLNGGKVVVASKPEVLDIHLLLELILKHDVNLLSCSPLLLNALNEVFPDNLLKRTGSCDNQTIYISGGDVLKSEYIENLIKNGIVYNTYGPTETTVCVTYFKCSQSTIANATIPIGKPIPNYRVYILSPNNDLQPVGVPGELCVTGDGVTRGYLNRPELTSEKFIYAPDVFRDFLEDEEINLFELKSKRNFYPNSYYSSRLYKSGDVAKWLEDGNIEYLRRIDQQVKIRGYRIELGEIENQLLKHPDVKEDVVLVKEDESGDKFLCAYYALKTESRISPEELREYLTDLFPPYMIPSYFMPVEKIPLTPQGKINRDALPQPEISLTSKYEVPRNHLEEELVKIWTLVMQINRGDKPIHTIGINDSFFALGGHSLKALTLLSRIQNELNIKIPLAELFKAPTIKGLSQYIKEAGSDTKIDIVPIEKREYYHLSSAQKRIYILQQMEPQSTSYNMTEVISLQEEPDKNRFTAIFNKLIRRHESLRTSFHLVENEAVQKIHDEVEFTIEYNILENEQVKNNQSKKEETESTDNNPPSIEDYLRTFCKPFDLMIAPLLRVRLVKIENGKAYLLVDMHHIISDALSHEILVNDFRTLYSGGDLPKLLVQYKEYSHWQTSETHIEKIKQQKQYWLNEFSGEIPILNLPIDYPRPVIQSFAGDILNFNISESTTQRLKEITNAENVTIYMLVLSALTILFARLSGQDDIVVGSPSMGRRYEELKPVMGMFVNTLTLRNYPMGEKTFTEYLSEVKHQTLAAFENQDFQFEELVELVEVKRDAGRNPLFDVMFSLFVQEESKSAEKEIQSKNQLNNTEIENTSYTNSVIRENSNNFKKGTAKFDLTIVVIDRGTDLSCSFQYCTKLFKAGTVRRFIEYFNHLIFDISLNKTKHLKDMEMISTDEKRTLLEEFNNSGTIYTQGKILHELFTESASRYPDSIALQISKSQKNKDSNDFSSSDITYVSYRELDENTNQMAWFLKGRGIGPGNLVGLKFKPSVEMIIAILGVLKAGCAYVPLNPKAPEIRNRLILRDCGVNLLLDETMPGLAHFKGHPLSEPPGTITSGDIAYIIFTSGSSGTPKGVPVSHGNLSPLLSWGFSELSLGPRDRILQNISYYFDWSVWEIFITLTSGSCFSIVTEENVPNPAETIEFIERHGITAFHATPTQYGYIAAEVKKQLTSLKYLFLGAERLTNDLLERSLQTVNPACRIFNMYGPTECTIISSVLEITERSNIKQHYVNVSSIPIGIPVGNTYFLVLNKDRRLCPVNIAGELYIGGDCVASGYLNNPELTAEKFVRLNPRRDLDEGALEFSIPHSPTHPLTQVTFYRTGDLVQWLSNGQVEFLSRIDQQVKIRGFRIELGEIENHLLNHPEIKEAVVLSLSSGTLGNTDKEDKYLCAYIVPIEAVTKLASIPGESDLKHYLSQFLPDYMVPTCFIEIEKIPLNPNGKIDKKKLPLPELEKQLGRHGNESVVSPQTFLETTLAKIWTEVLGRESLSVDDNFFTLGGHSLNATVMAAKIKKELNTNIPLGEIFRTPTIRELAQSVNNARKETFFSIKPVEKREFYLLSSAQKRLYILQQMELQSTAYNMPEIIPLPVKPDKDKLEKTFNRLITRHESLKTSFHMIGNQQVQRINENVSFEIEYHDVTLEDTIPAYDSSVRPFDLAQAPLFRVGIVKANDQKYSLFVDMHHIISDGISHQLLVTDFLAIFEGKDLLPLRIQYKDYSHWQNNETQKEIFQFQQKYWLNEFSNEIPILNLPIDYPRPALQSFSGGTLSFNISSIDTHELKRIAFEENVTVFMILLSVLNLMFSQLSNQEDIIVGTPVAGRRHADLYPIIGMFVNTLALRNYPLGTKTFRTFLSEVKTQSLNAYENQDYPFENLVEQVKIKRDTSRNPLFDIMFSFLVDEEKNSPEVKSQKSNNHKAQDDIENQSSDQVKPQESKTNNTAKFDLTVAIIDKGNQLFCSFQYCTKLFKQETIERFMDYFNQLISGISKNRNKPLKDLEMVSQNERKTILEEFNKSGDTFTRTKILHELFTDTASLYPDSIAIVINKNAGNDSTRIYNSDEIFYLSYRKLNEKANQMAWFLLNHGATPGQFIGLKLEPSVEMLVAILGVLKSGCTYVPLNPKAPESRNQLISNDCGVKLFLTGTEQEEANFNRLPVKEPSIVVLPDSFAYTIFTSGSTGTPKGVLISHANLSPLLHWGYRELGIGTADRTMQNLSYYFDWSVWEIFITLTTGACLAIANEEELLNPPDTISFIQRFGITIVHATPTQYGYIAIIGEKQLNSLKYLFLGAEKLTYNLLERSLKTVTPTCRVFNMYGPTECTIISAVQEINQRDECYQSYTTISSIPIGTPVGNTRLLILNKYGYLSPLNISGELFIGGDCVASGYLNKPELTAAKFYRPQFGLELHKFELESAVPHSPTHPLTHLTFYRTGDQARWLCDGTVEFLGRIDQQVKIRGFRIELGEIEKCLLVHPKIKEAIVLATSFGTAPVTDQDNRYLCAYVIRATDTEDTQSTPIVQDTVNDFKVYLSQFLPDYMIPSYFIEIEKIPLNPNGKIDLKALPSPEADRKTGLNHNEDSLPPRTMEEVKLVQIWSDVLGIASIGIIDNFFTLGGHSLNATVVAAKIQKELDTKIPLSEIFRNPTIKGLAQYISNTRKEKFFAIEAVEKKEFYLLSSAQKRLYILQQMELESTAYNMPEVITLPGKPDAVRLEATFKQLIHHHESLRTSFHMRGSEPIQCIQEEIPFELTIHEITPNRNAALTQDSFIRPFDLASPPLIRAGLLRMSGEKYSLFVDMHHIISDGASHQVMINDFLTLLDGRNLLPLRIQYKDFAVWQNSNAQKVILEKEKIFWAKEFSGEIPVLNLPYDFSRPVIQSFDGDTIDFIIPAEITSYLKEIALQEEMTLYMVIFALFTILLARLSNQEDIVVGTPVAGRNHADLEFLIGMFVNTLALRSYPIGEKLFRQFLSEVKTKTLETFENQGFPFEELVEMVDVNRDAGRNPLFDVMFSFFVGEEKTPPDTPPDSQNPIFSVIEENNSHYSADTFKYTDGDKYKISKFDLTLVVVDRGSQLNCSVQYCTKLFKRNTIRQLIHYFEQLTLTLINNDFNIRLANLEIMSQNQLKHILFDLNNTKKDFPGNNAIHDLFSIQAEKTPDTIALVAHLSGERVEKQYQQLSQKEFRIDNTNSDPYLTLSYAEFNEKVTKLAGFLTGKGVRPGTIAGIIVERSIAMVIGIYAILKAGGTYLPVDPLNPAGRINYILNDCAAGILITERNYSSKVQSNKEILFLSEILNHPLSYTHTNESPQRTQSLAYIIYTSGSTGKPKGVMVNHDSVINVLTALQSQYPLNKTHSFLFKTSYAFDVSVTELFGWFWEGGRLIILEENGEKDPVLIINAIENQRVTHINFVPSMFNVFMDFLNEANINRISGLMYILLAGEALSPNTVEKFNRMGQCQRIHLINLYGPTETTIYASYYPLSQWEGGETVPIGKPVYNYLLYILDRYGILQPPGVIGELAISGIGLARGYLNQPELTSEKFVPFHIERNTYKFLTEKNTFHSPTHLLNDSTYYRTGDLARWDSDGNIQFLGRIDQQIKIRGYRIELGEIENLLLKHPKITDALITIKEGKGRDKFICAYVIPEKNAEAPSSQLNTSGLEEYLSQSLPSYMIPSHFMYLKSFPVTSSGKIDRQGLPNPEFEVNSEYVAPRDFIEMELVRLWSEILGIEKNKIGIESNFFQLGGHSLKATILSVRIHKSVNVQVSLKEIFRFPRIRDLAEYIKSRKKDTFISINSLEKREYYVLSSAQKRLYILQQMEPNSTAYNMPEVIPLPGKPDAVLLMATFKQLINRHESLRTSFHMRGNDPIQCVHEEIQFEVEHHIVTVNSAATLHDSFIRPFDLSNPPLIRAGILEKQKTNYFLLVDMHHIISDGTSHTVLMKDFLALFEGSALPPLRIQYKEFASWQNSKSQIKQSEQEKIYWSQKLSGEIPVLTLPCDFPRPVIQKFDGETVDFIIPSELTVSLRNIALRHGVTLYMVILALVNILLFRLSNQEDIIIGTPVAGRRHADLESIIGIFVNTLALRNYPIGEKSFNQFLLEVKTRTIEAFENQDFPFEEIVELIDVKRDTSRNPVFDVMFSLIAAEEISSSGVSKEIEDTVFPSEHEEKSSTTSESKKTGEGYKTKTAKFDLTIVAADRGNHLLCSFQYCTKLFKAETIKRFVDYFIHLVSAVAKNRNACLKDLEMVSHNEKLILLKKLNTSDGSFVSEKTVHQLFIENVEKNPDTIAVLISNEIEQENILSISRPDISFHSYVELNEKSNQMALYLQDQGVKPGEFVGLKLEPSVEMLIALLGVLKSGCAYVPMNPKAPETRNQFIIRDCDINVVLTGDEQQENQFKNLPVNKLSVENLPESFAYIIFTSGSTGTPKGVPITHANLSPLLHWGYRYLGIGSIDRTLKNLSYYFDWSVWEIFITLTTGACLAITNKEERINPAKTIAFIQRHRISILHATPTQYGFLADITENQLSTLKYLFLGAEKLSHNLLERSLKIVTDSCRVFNMYGPTECTIISLVYEIERDVEIHLSYPNLSSIPIGTPAGNTFVMILDKYRRLCPENIAGELYIGGDCVASGYLNNPEMTADKFIQQLYNIGLYEMVMQYSGPDSFTYPHNRSSVYRTGDLVRWLTDGKVEFLGRIDQQIKIRGFRIELGEIESRILKYPKEEIKQAAVILRDFPNNEKYICAYIILSSNTIKKKLQTLSTDIKDYLSQFLPEYMIPAFIIQIDRFPLNPNGKLEIKALPSPEIQTESQLIQPRNEIEKQLAHIWFELLGRDFGIDENFFEVGGHSLKATILISRIHKELNVKLPMAEVFKTPRIRELSEYINKLKKEKYTAIEPVEKKEYYQLSAAQKRLYILQQMESHNIGYNMPHIIPLEEGIAKEKLEDTFKKLIYRHESLRTSFEMVNQEPVQRIHENVDFSIEYSRYDINIDLKGEDIREKFTRVFNLNKAPLLRAFFLEISPVRYILFLDLHHIISDGVSQNILTNDFMELYRGEELPPLRLSYKDFSQWQNCESYVRSLQSQEVFWSREFSTDELPVLNLPTDYPRPRVQSFEGKSVGFGLSEIHTRRLRNIIAESNSTLFISFLSIYTLLLSKLCGQEDVIVGTAVAGRRHVNLERIVGMFVNTLALRNFPQGEKTVTEFLTEAKERILEAFENQEYQFENLVEKVYVRRDASRNPIFDVMLNVQNHTENQDTLTTEVETNNYTHRKGVSKFDLSWTMIEYPNQLWINIGYSIKLFKPHTIEKFIRHFQQLMEVLGDRRELRLSEIEIITATEKQQILLEFNDTGIEFPLNKTIAQLFTEQAENNPHTIAVSGEIYGTGHTLQEREQDDIDVASSALSYRELENKSKRIAAFLKEKGVKPDTIVGIIVERSIEMIVIIMGILKAGGAYLPIAADYPEERIDYMLSDSGARVLLASPVIHSKVKTGNGERCIEIIEIRDLLSFSNLVPISQTGSFNCLFQPENLAYVIYTSGSTGRPKGVMLTHGNVINLVWGLKEKVYRNYTQCLRICLVAPYVFDASVKQLFAALLLGHTLYIPPGRIRGDISRLLLYYQKYKIHVSDGTPVHLGLITENLFSQTSECTVKHFLIGGDALSQETTKRFFHYFKRRRKDSPKLTNVYGPTECCVDSTLYEVTKETVETFERIPIGKPMPNYQVYIVDRWYHLQPIWVVGELCIMGAGVSRGYLNNPELTSEKFDYFKPGDSSIKNHPLTSDKSRFSSYSKTQYLTYSTRYRTGDLARWRGDGNIEFLGRIDMQVKIRGFRIELGEIENQLLKHKEIKEALVIVRDRWNINEENEKEKTICAYFISDIEIDVPKLKYFLSKSLPDYMIPSYFMQIEKIPLTPNGKIDRKALPSFEIKATEKYIPPRNITEDTLAKIWSQLLFVDITSIGIDDNFFELGGHSLKATIMITRIQTELKSRVPLTEIYKTPTIRGLGEYIRIEKKQLISLEDEKLVLLKCGSRDTGNIFFIPPVEGRVEAYIDFCQNLDEDLGFSYWGIMAEQNVCPQNITLSQISAKFLQRIKKIQPHGPYFILGWSFGGANAFEIALQLEQEEEEVAFLGIFDTGGPRKDRNSIPPLFAVETERELIGRFISDLKFNEKIEKAVDINEIWSLVIDYLENGDSDPVETIKKINPEFQAPANQEQLNVVELITHFNNDRTFVIARRRYVPSKKLKAPVHFFSATQSSVIKESWENYCLYPISYYDVLGTHESIFLMPNAIPMAKLFSKIVKNSKYFLK